MRYCICISLEREAFLEITGTVSYTFSDGTGTRSFSCYNHNAFLDMMEGALSGKTGFQERQDTAMWEHWRGTKEHFLYPFWLVDGPITRLINGVIQRH